MSAVIALGFFEQGALLAARTTRDSRLYLWRVDGEGNAPVEGPDSVTAAAADRQLRISGESPVAANSSGRIVARADGNVLHWSDGVVTEPLHYAAIGTAGLRAVRLAPDDRTMLTVSSNGDVVVWDLENGAVAHYLPGAAGTTTGFASSVAFSADGTSMTGLRGPDRERWSWALSSLSPLVLPPSAQSAGSSTDYFIAGNADVGAPARPMAPQLGIVGEPEKYITTLGTLAKGGEIAVYAGYIPPYFSPYLIAESLKTGAGLWTWRGDRNLDGRLINAVAATPDGTTVTAAFGDGTVIWLDGETGNFRKSAKTATRLPMNVLQYSQRGDLVAGASRFGELVVWRVDGTQLATPARHEADVLSLAFSADSRVLASGAADDTIELWDLANGKALPSLLGHTSPVTALAFASRSDILISASEDSTLRMWKGGTGELLASATAMPDGSWMAISPQGFFDGTRGGWNAVPFRYPSEPMRLYRPEQFFKQFYQPGLLADVLARQEPILALLREQRDARAALDVAKLRSSKPPIVQLRLQEPVAPGARSARLDISVNDGGSGMRDLRIFRNGSLVRFLHGDLAPGVGGDFSVQAAVELTPGPNELSAYAFNRDDVKSEDASVTVAGSDALRRPGNAYVIAIGINRYSNRDFDLRYAAPDAENLSNSLSANLAKAGPYTAVPILLLNDEATRANLLFALRRLAGQAPAPQAATPLKLQQLGPAHPSDAVVIYFAGHGEASAGHYYLLPYDVGYTGRKAAISKSALAAILSQAISDQDLNEYLERIDAGHMMLVIDACYSGQVLESSDPRRGPLNARGIGQLAYEKGAYVLAASQSDAEALELARLGHGLLTYVLVEKGLGDFDADLNGDGIVTVKEWFRYAETAVPTELISLRNDRASSGRPISVGGNPLITQRPQFYFRRELSEDWVLDRRGPSP